MDTLQPKLYSVLLIGDDGIDIYKYGDVHRISPEAPIPILNMTHETMSHGMAGNVKRNLEAFGLQVTYKHGVKTCTKIRFVDNKTKHHLLRVDEDQISRPVSLASEDLSSFDAIVLSDYNKGSVDLRLAEFISKSDYVGPVFVDTKKKELSTFNGFYVKVNEDEYNNRVTDALNTIVTLGARGAKFKDKIYPTPKVEMHDVCGAGDTFLAALVYKFLQTKDIESAIIFANKAASISVQHFGVYALSKEDIDEIER
jgi:bifunctional ADP-heptose synthase (sugar kinase/adenylyltransferase)